MNGITIVEEHLCRIVELPALIGLGIFITLLCFGEIVMFVFMYNQSNKDTRNKILSYGSTVFIVIMYFIFWIVQINNYNDTHMEYTVTVDDSVSFNDFHAKYDIISINGNEYRVAEK